MDFKFYTHNINLFAYYLSEKIDSLGDYQPDWLWKKCDEIVAKTLNPVFQFNIKENLDLEHQPEEPWANLNKHFPKTDDYHPLYVQPHKSFSDNSRGKIDLDSKTAIIYPVQLYDSYGFGLKLINPKNENSKALNNTDIALVNPNNCLMLDVNKNNEYFLGQTLLVTIRLENRQKLKYKGNKEKLKSIADNYIESLLPDDMRKTQFNRSGNLFGSPIFEYGIIRASQSYSHIIIWFIQEDKSEEKFDKYYQQLLDLFFFRAKVIHAFKQVKRIEKLTKNISRDIQIKIKDSQFLKEPGASNKVDLDRLQTLLIELPKVSVEYAEKLRFIKEYQNIIVEDSRNYTDKIYEIKSNFSDEDFSFLELFTHRACHTFQERVIAAVNFFQLDINLIDNAIDSIRGQVAIEQARRERQLQAIITGVGFGVAGAGNLASSYEAAANIPEANIPEQNQRFDYPHFFSSLALSSIGGILLAIFAAALVSQMLNVLQLAFKPKQQKTR
jgi:hypothetical protein